MRFAVHRSFAFRLVFMSTATATVTGTYPGNAPQPKNFSPLVRQFLDYLKLEKHFSDYTVKSYGADLIQFGQFLTGEIGNAETARGIAGS